MRQATLLKAIVVGVAVGVAVGWTAGERAVAVAWVGDLFLNALKTLVLPLVFCSMVEAMASIVASGDLGRMAKRTFLFYLATTTAAVILGLVLVNLMKPGDGVVVGSLSQPPAVEGGGIEAIAGSLVSGNIFAAAVAFQVLAVLVFALAFGAALAAVGEKGKPAVLFFASCNQALLHLVGWLMYAAPVGVGALIAARLGQAGGGAAFAAEIAAIGRYCVAVIFGLLVHACVVLPLALWVLTGRSPRRYAANMAEALVTAFSTASSSATLAVTMRCVEENRVRPATASFVLPLGATVNMDGTALYEAIAAMFIAQAWGVELSLGAQAVVALTATLASIGAAGIPQAGLVTMIMVLEAVGLPLEGIAAILAVDWFLDRCRTTVNVWGDAVAAAVVDATASGAPEKAG